MTLLGLRASGRLSTPSPRPETKVGPACVLGDRLAASSQVVPPPQLPEVRPRKKLGWRCPAQPASPRSCRKEREAVGWAQMKMCLKEVEFRVESRSPFCFQQKAADFLNVSLVRVPLQLFDGRSVANRKFEGFSSKLIFLCPEEVSS